MCCAYILLGIYKDVYLVISKDANENINAWFKFLCWKFECLQVPIIHWILVRFIKVMVNYRLFIWSLKYESKTKNNTIAGFLFVSIMLPIASENSMQNDIISNAQLLEGHICREKTNTNIYVRYRGWGLTMLGVWKVIKITIT